MTTEKKTQMAEPTLERRMKEWWEANNLGRATIDMEFASLLLAAGRLDSELAALQAERDVMNAREADWARRLKHDVTWVYSDGKVQYLGTEEQRDILDIVAELNAAAKLESKESQ